MRTGNSVFSESIRALLLLAMSVPVLLTAAVAAADELTSPIEVADRMRWIHRVCAIGHDFEDKVAPVACGNLHPGTSWRLIVAGFIQLPLDDLGEAVFGDTHSEREVISWFTFVRDPDRVTQENSLARLQAVLGPGTFFQAAADRQEGLPRLNAIKPGHPLADVILFVDVYEPPNKWDEPGDFVIPPIGEEIPKEKYHSLGTDRNTFHVTFADGAVWRVSRAVPQETLRRFFYVAEARVLDREKELGDYAVDRLHPHKRVVPVPVENVPTRN